MTLTIAQRRHLARVAPTYERRMGLAAQLADELEDLTCLAICGWSRQTRRMDYLEAALAYLSRDC